MKIRTALLALAVCASGAAAIAQPATSGFDAMREAPYSTGDWRYSLTAEGSEARFGTLFLVRCERANHLVLLQRLAAPGTDAPITVTTDTSVRSFATGAARLSARDPLLDAIAFSRGRIIVGGGGADPLILPSWPEAARSIENCRN